MLMVSTAASNQTPACRARPSKTASVDDHDNSLDPGTEAMRKDVVDAFADDECKMLDASGANGIREILCDFRRFVIFCVKFTDLLYF